MGSRHFLGLATLIVALSLVSAADAADAVKKKVTTPGYDDSSIGVLGAHHSPSEGGVPVNRNAAPPAPIAAPAMPQVEAESPVVPGPGSGPVPLPAAPRPDASIEGAPAGSSASAGVHPPQQVNTFLAAHPVISGLIAGLIGTDLGSILYGGTMMGDETAAMIGFFGRIALVVLVAVLTVRLLWSLIGGASDDQESAPRGPRREPSFGRSEADAGDGRREPILRAERPSYENDRSRRER
jgi:hypothetical protein